MTMKSTLWSRHSLVNVAVFPDFSLSLPCAPWELFCFDISGRQFLATKNLVDKYDFPPLSYISVLEKKTDLRVLILFWFSFPGLQVRIPASRPWLLCVLCASWSAVAGHKHALWQEPPSQRLATLLTPPTGHHPSPGYRCHLRCSCTTEEGPCLLAGMLEHTSGKL